MKQKTLEEKFELINSREPEQPTEADLTAFEAAEKDDYEISLDDYKDELEGYSGKLNIRIPRSLHKLLKQEAKAEGVSLNNFILYKLAH